MVKKAYPGTISSIILSVIVVMLLLVPFYTANHLQKVRYGEAKYEFKEVMCFDIDSKSQFMHDNYVYPTSKTRCGAGAVVWFYTSPSSTHSQKPIVMSSLSIPGTVDGYGTSTFFECPSYPFVPTIYYNWLRIYLTITKEDIVERDITRIDIYIDISQAQWTHMGGGIRGQEGGVTGISDPAIELGAVTSITVTVEDLLQVNTLNPGEKLYWSFNIPKPDSAYHFTDGAFLVFDMQFYYIEEIKITTADYMGIAMIGGGIFTIFCSVLMLPVITFSGVIGRIVGKGGD